ncbi:hypothetical protein SUGI_1078470 [Cryptomeria japonica]|nr:hypothetical protein SUGI_1078470 [Cryptomeria japonica]
MENYAIQVVSLSPNATERDVRDFFSYSGTVETVELERVGEDSQVAFVTFQEPYAVETALLLTGATIIDQKVCIVRWGDCEDSFDDWRTHSWRLQHDDEAEVTRSRGFVQNPREAVTVAQDVVSAMLSKGYILGKDALSKAKAFDESHQVTASAAAKVISLGEKIEQTSSSAGSAVVNSRYFSSGALWLSGVLSKAAQAAADLGTRGHGN